ncbi:MAG: hypothetical protein ABI600_20620 [Luteolibacter sp.]
MAKILLRLAAALLILTGLGTVAFYFLGPPATGALHWDPPVVKKSLMTFAYKVYGNPAAQNGRNFVSKIVLHNDGKGMVRNFSISYQIPDYIPWTTEETHAEIPPGQTIVKLFYPQLPSKVTQLANQTTATLETKIRWFDKPGEPHEEILRSNIELRGVNEVEYTDLPANELLTWYDMFISSPFVAAMVTPNDPVVKEYAALLTQRTGGTTAGIAGGTEEIVRVMKALYDYMCDSNMRYTSDQGVPSTIGDIHTTVQTVRMPRDVIITNQGLCIELALLWASVMEHLGLRTTVVFRPGHAFTLVWCGDGPQDFIPIECTAITPMAVGAKARVPFEDAVKMASQDLREQKYQIWLNVQQYQAQGFRPPELPAIDIDKIKNILASRQVRESGGGGEVAQEAESKEQPLPEGFVRWAGANGLVSMAIPSYWARMENPPVAGMVFTAQDAQTSVAANVFYFPNLQTAKDAMTAAQRGVAAASGAKVRVGNTQQKGDATIYSGTTLTSMGTNSWVGIFQPTANGVVGVFVGAAKAQFDRNQQMIQTLIQHTHIGGAE